MTSALTIATEGLLQEDGGGIGNTKVEVGTEQPRSIVSAKTTTAVSVSDKNDVVIVSPRKRTRFYPDPPC